MWEKSEKALATMQGQQTGEVVEDYSNTLIGLGRTSEPEDVANFVSYLASKDSDYMTGQSIMIDGGIEFF